MAAGFNNSSRMVIRLEVETTLGWPQQRVMEYEIRDCDGCAEPWFAPNPVTEDELTITVPANTDSNSTYTLLDQQGNIRLSGKLKSKETKVDTKTLEAGLYLLKTEHNGKPNTRRVMIKK